MKGGNTDELYQDDGRLKMAQELVDRHPDVATVSWKWGRFQHHVDYSIFKKNEFKRKHKRKKYSDQNDEYGLVLQEYVDGEWINIQKDMEFSIRGQNNDEDQKDGSDKRTRKRKKRTRRKRNS